MTMGRLVPGVGLIVAFAPYSHSTSTVRDRSEGSRLRRTALFQQRASAFLTDNASSSRRALHVVVDGSKTPELVPDGTAYNHFLSATAGVPLIMDTPLA